MRQTPPPFRAAVQVRSLHKAGLYLHIPFCQKKCAYCDFYSSFVSDALIDEYVGALSKEIRKWGGCFGRPIDTIYFGGGTPSLLGGRIASLIDAVRDSFEVSPDVEITAELNPGGDVQTFLSASRRAGVNRLSIGVQSGDDKELALLGRGHTAAQAIDTVRTARELGFENISLDIMLGLPESTFVTLNKSLDFIIGLEPEHISAYILKIEPNTRFGRECPPLPDEDEQARQYLMMCERLESAGYKHYEISNFSKPGYESRHNLKYWRGAEYLGIGPAAHSFAGGKRFYYPRDLRAFINEPTTYPDGSGGDEQERLMLGLRLREGVELSGYKQLEPLLGQLEKANLGRTENGRFSLTDQGMLVSNSIITEILERIT